MKSRTLEGQALIPSSSILFMKIELHLTSYNFTNIIILQNIKTRDTWDEQTIINQLK